MMKKMNQCLDFSVTLTLNPLIRSPLILIFLALMMILTLEVVAHLNKNHLRRALRLLAHPGNIV